MLHSFRRMLQQVRPQSPDVVLKKTQDEVAKRLGEGAPYVDRGT